MDSLFSCDPGEMAKAFYYDTILYDDARWTIWSTKVGKERLVVGSDYPFTIKQDRPAEFAEAGAGHRARNIREQCDEACWVSKRRPTCGPR